MSTVQWAKVTKTRTLWCVTFATQEIIVDSFTPFLSEKGNRISSSHVKGKLKPLSNAPFIINLTWWWFLTQNQIFQIIYSGRPISSISNVKKLHTYYCHLVSSQNYWREKLQLYSKRFDHSIIEFRSFVFIPRNVRMYLKACPHLSFSHHCSRPDYSCLRQQVRNHYSISTRAAPHFSPYCPCDLNYSHAKSKGK